MIGSRGWSKSTATTSNTIQDEQAGIYIQFEDQIISFHLAFTLPDPLFHHPTFLGGRYISVTDTTDLVQDVKFFPERGYLEVSG